MTDADAEKKAEALMMVIEKMMARYTSNHRRFMDAEMFRLKSKARKIHSAGDDKEFQSATADL